MGLLNPDPDFRLTPTTNAACWPTQPATGDKVDSSWHLSHLKS